MSNPTSNTLTIEAEDFDRQIQSIPNLTVSDREQVLDFVRRYPNVLPFIPEIAANIRSYFPDSKLLLEVSVDPEVVGWEELLVVIDAPRDLSPEEVLHNYKQFGYGWWYDSAAHKQNNLGVHITYL